MAELIIEYCCLGIGCFVFGFTFVLSMRTKRRKEFTFSISFDKKTDYGLNNDTFYYFIKSEILSGLIYDYSDAQGICISKIQISKIYNSKLEVKCTKEEYLDLLRELATNPCYHIENIH